MQEAARRTPRRFNLERVSIPSSMRAARSHTSACGTFHGHREVNPHKTCPVYDYRAILGLDAVGRLGRGPQPSTDADDLVDISRTLRRGSKGDDVRWLQALLNRMTLYELGPRRRLRAAHREP